MLHISYLTPCRSYMRVPADDLRPELVVEGVSEVRC
jgi:hypothetical protein